MWQGLGNEHRNLGRRCIGPEAGLLQWGEWGGYVAPVWKGHENGAMAHGGGEMDEVMFSLWYNEYTDN